MRTSRIAGARSVERRVFVRLCPRLNAHALRDARIAHHRYACEGGCNGASLFDYPYHVYSKALACQTPRGRFAGISLFRKTVLTPALAVAADALRGHSRFKRLPLLTILHPIPVPTFGAVTLALFHNGER